MPAGSGAANLGARSGGLLPWLPIVVGLGALYLPSLLDLFQGIWSQDDQMHGPIVLALSSWLIYRNWSAMHTVGSGGASAWGWVAVILGLLLYTLGRSQGMLVPEIGSAIFVLAGLILLGYGFPGLRAQWFALFFMLFMVPLPGFIVDVVTSPMKTAVSYVAEQVLYWLGYPIARTGVILQIGPYMLLVADACAGLHTLLTLEALGLLYLNLIRRDSIFRNVGLALFIIPTSFTANVIRVMALVLITYHFGDAAGQGFLHGFAGMVLFLSALALIISADAVLQTFEKYRLRARERASMPP